MRTTDSTSSQTNRQEIIVIVHLIQPLASWVTWKKFPSTIRKPSKRMSVLCRRAWWAGVSSPSLATWPNRLLHFLTIRSMSGGSPLCSVMSVLQMRLCHMTFRICLWYMEGFETPGWPAESMSPRCIRGLIRQVFGYLLNTLNFLNFFVRYHYLPFFYYLAVSSLDPFCLNCLKITDKWCMHLN